MSQEGNGIYVMCSLPPTRNSIRVASNILPCKLPKVIPQRFLLSNGIKSQSDHFGAEFGQQQWHHHGTIMEHHHAHPKVDFVGVSIVHAQVSGIHVRILPC